MMRFPSLAAITTLGVLGACSGEQTRETDPRTSTPHNGAATELEDYEAMDKPQFVKSIEAQLAVINSELAELQDKAAQAGSAMKEQLRVTLESLPEKRDALAQKVRDLKQSVAAATSEARKELVESCRSLEGIIKRALDKASSQG